MFDFSKNCAKIAIFCQYPNLRENDYLYQMKRISLLLLVLLLAGPLSFAQEARRVMTMEEAVLGRGLMVQSPSWHWTGDKAVVAQDEPGAAPRRQRPEPLAYTRGNNLYYKDKQGVEHAITAYADPGIVCGQSVSRNEFGISGGIFVSPDSSKIAFYRKDERAVTLFPLLDITTRTGTLREIRYPMNGMTSEQIAVGVYDIASGTTVWLDVTDFDEERYLTNVTWGPGSDRLYIQVLDRPQKNVHLNVYDAADGKCLGTLLTEHNDRWVEPQEPLVFLESDPDSFLYFTDNRDGYKNYYLCSASGKSEPRRLTDVDADCSFVAQRGRYIYYYSAEVSPVENHLFRVDLKTGKKLRLTREKGWHMCQISPDGKYFLDSWSSLDVPRVTGWGTTDGKKFTELYRAPEPAPQLTSCRIETGTVKSADGKYDNHYGLVYPLDFDPSKKYPVILYVYGGPHSQLIRDVYQGGMSRWDIYMAQHGYIVFTMDGRGTPNRGAEYEKAIHRQCGQAEMADQMEGMKWLMSHPWVDRDRIGVHGWSYGGFMTISLAVNYPDVFKVAVAGGPVIDWKWYEVMYGERYMETEATNPEGFAKTSLIPDTVVWEHSLSFVESCIKNNVQVDYFPYPTHPHNVRGVDRVHLMDKVTMYFNDYL